MAQFGSNHDSNAILFLPFRHWIRGKSLTDLKAAGLPEKLKDYDTGFIKTDRWIETIYNSTQKK